MCLGKLYVDNDTAPLLENVTGLVTDGNRVKCTTLFGEEEVYTGKIAKIDFNKSEIFITKE
ncbi:MAG: CooT family nickel-binding protein [Firmicutes bacterium]|nr:CooT family nickel-binding protein [Bacillota bacterium]NLZ39638.1 CooT family nickel-binding protein [Bacillota bacterium]